MTLARFREILRDPQAQAQFLNWEAVPRPSRAHHRRDLHIFLTLASLGAGSDPMISAASHDEIYLQPSVESILPLLDEETLINLIRAGLRYDRGSESLTMFV